MDMAIGDKYRAAKAAADAREAEAMQNTPDQESPAVALTQDQFAQLLAAIGARGGDVDIAKAITDGMAQVAQPIPENKASNGISEANPFGTSSPRPGFKCEMWMGVIDDEKNVKKWFQLDPNDVTIWEECALNTLEPTEQIICSLGSETPDLKVIVEAKRNSITQALERMTIAVPLVWVQKGPDSKKNQIPGITEIVRQVNGKDFRRREISLDAMKQVQAAQRSGNYTFYPEKVAA
jgi:hypothetical protein